MDITDHLQENWPFTWTMERTLQTSNVGSKKTRWKLRKKRITELAQNIYLETDRAVFKTQPYALSQPDKYNHELTVSITVEVEIFDAYFHVFYFCDHCLQWNLNIQILGKGCHMCCTLHMGVSSNGLIIHENFVTLKIIISMVCIN